MSTNLNTSFETNLVDTHQHIQEEHSKSTQDLPKSHQPQPNKHLKEISSQVINDPNAQSKQDQSHFLNSGKENQGDLTNFSTSTNVLKPELAQYQVQQLQIDQTQQKIIQGLNQKHKRQIEFITSLQQSNQSLKLRVKQLEDNEKKLKEIQDKKEDQAHMEEIQRVLDLQEEQKDEDSLSDVVQETKVTQKQSEQSERIFYHVSHSDEKDNQKSSGLSIVKKNEQESKVLGGRNGAQDHDYLPMKSIGKVEDIARAEKLKQQQRDQKNSRNNGNVQNSRGSHQHHQNHQERHQDYQNKKQGMMGSYDGQRYQDYQYNSRGSHHFQNSSRGGTHHQGNNTAQFHPNSRGGRPATNHQRDQHYNNSYQSDFQDRDRFHNNKSQHQQMVRPPNRGGHFQSQRGGGAYHNNRDSHYQSNYQANQATRWDDFAPSKKHYDNYNPQQYSNHYSSDFNPRPRGSHQSNHRQNSYHQDPQRFQNRGGQGNYGSQKNGEFDHHRRGGNGMSRGGCPQVGSRGDFNGNRRGGGSQWQGSTQRDNRPYGNNTRGGGQQRGGRGAHAVQEQFDEEYDRDCEVEVCQVTFKQQQKEDNDSELIITGNSEIRTSNKTSGSSDDQQEKVQGEKKKKNRGSKRGKNKNKSTSSQNMNGNDETNSMSSTSLQNNNHSDKNSSIGISEGDDSNVAFNESNSRLNDLGLRQQTFNATLKKTQIFEEEKMHGFKDDKAQVNTRRQHTQEVKRNQSTHIYNEQDCYSDSKEQVEEIQSQELKKSNQTTQVQVQTKPNPPSSTDALVTNTHLELEHALAQKDTQALGEALLRARERGIKEYVDYKFFNGKMMELCNAEGH